MIVRVFFVLALAVSSALIALAQAGSGSQQTGEQFLDGTQATVTATVVVKAPVGTMTSPQPSGRAFPLCQVARPGCERT